MAGQQITRSAAGGLRTVIAILVLLALLAFVIKDPSGAADLARDVGSFFSGAVEGIVEFFRELDQ